MAKPLSAPFPWFGGKSRAAPMIWDALGNVANYVEPFAGSLAVLLSRPHASKIETVNDLDCYLANFWRALAADPSGVADACDWPVNEADLHARHQWLMARDDFRERMRNDPDYYDVRIAGWWVWGLCQWIGSGWCTHARVADQLPHLGDAGRGVHRPSQKLPHLGDAGRASNNNLRDYLGVLSARLRRVRVACGDWSRVLGDSVTWRHGVTGVVLDPPYTNDEHAITYGAGGDNIAAGVAQWAFENGGNPQLRIVLCGYDGEHQPPNDWRVVEWKARGGFGSQGNGRGRENAARERLWLSPHCNAPMGLFEASS